MESAARVLLIGEDEDHLDAKANVLRHFWPVQTIAPESDRVSRVETEVAVVCLTIPEPQRQQWIERLRQQKPELLLVKMNGFDSGPHAGADAIVDEAHGPGALVSAIYQLLTERGLPSRRWPQYAEADWVQ